MDETEYVWLVVTFDYDGYNLPHHVSDTREGARKFVESTYTRKSYVWVDHMGYSVLVGTDYEIHRYQRNGGRK